MKQASFLATLFLISLSSFADNLPQRQDYLQSVTGDTIHVVAAADMQTMLNEVIAATGLQANFELQSADVKNIEAVIRHHKRIIRYNPGFIQQVYAQSRSRWTLIALLAHEAAHHLNGHTIKRSGSRPELELEADAFAGFVLHRLGATVEEAQQVMFYIANTRGSSTHPARNERLSAIRKGWNRAAGGGLVE